MSKVSVVGALAVLGVLVTSCTSSTNGSGSGATSTTSPGFPSTVATSAPVTGSATSPVGSSPASVPPSATGSPAPGSTAAGPAAAGLAAINLQAADLPAGYTPSAHNSADDANDAKYKALLVRCVGGRDTSAEQLGKAHSPDFDTATSSASSSAMAFRSDADLAADIAILRSPKISTCYQQLARQELTVTLPTGAAIDTLTFHIAPGAAGGPSNVVGTGAGVIIVTRAGQRLTIHLAVAFIVGKLTEAEVDVETFRGPVPGAFFAGLVRAVAGRAALR